MVANTVAMPVKCFLGAADLAGGPHEYFTGAPSCYLPDPCSTVSLTLPLWPTSQWRSSQPCRDSIKVFVCGYLGCMHVRLTATKSHWLQALHSHHYLLLSLLRTGTTKNLGFLLSFNFLYTRKDLKNKCVHWFSLQLSSIHTYYYLAEKHKGLYLNMNLVNQEEELEVN